MGAAIFVLGMAVLAAGVPALAVYLLLKLSRCLASSFAGRRFDPWVVRAYVVSAILFAASFWLVSLACYYAIWYEPPPLFEDEPSLPLVLQWLPLAGVALGVVTTSGVAANTSAEGLQSFLTGAGAVTAAICAVSLAVMLYLGIHRIG